ncbi:MAG: DUF2207 domain-containing protein [Bacilli bacterium]|nr:DUF2207 domain-containing protein [Bacilli bacterium]
MGKKKKRFITKRNIRWKLFDTIIFIAIIINSSRLIFTQWEDVIIIFNSTDDVMVHIFWIVILLFIIFLNAIPHTLIYLGLRWGIKKYNRSRVTFDVKTDLEYYREKFNGVTPATMSLLMDLSLETEKDLGAMKLYYEINNIFLYEKDGSLYLNNPNNVRINKSDDILLNCLYKCKKDIFTLNEWRENVICEAVNNNLIKRKKKDEKNKSGCGIFLFLHLLSLGFIVFFCFNAEKISTLLNSGSTTLESNLDLLNFMVDNPDYILAFLMGLGLIVSILVGFWSFISGIIHLIVSKSMANKDKFKRTYEGNVLAEKLYGMKNFIHDFSNLDEATKKHLVLWREFLVYAVTLEENDIILKEISGLYNTDLLSYKHYKN